MRFKIRDESMLPTLKPGDYLFVNKFSKKLFTMDIIVFKHDDKFLVKRIEKIFGDKIFVIGDNTSSSTDSRTLGYIDKNSVVGKVLMKARQ